tara:strand:+ start:953 stop:1594 length:642 start_codon:yes stop_codon:yes gene_type:complete
MLVRQVWLIAWALLLIISLMALWDVSEKTCHKHIPILLSRALTTDPWRGFILVFNLLAVGSSFYLNSVVMVMGFLGFLCAFLVSLFQTNSHNALIVFSTACVMYECFPKGGNLLWKIHWWSTLFLGHICSVWLLYADYICETVYCAECSWWYISEYLFFWSMFLNVWWRINPSEVLHDEIKFVQITAELDASETAELYASEPAADNTKKRIKF